MSEPEINPAARTVVDTNIGITNVVDLQDPKARELVVKSLDQCIELLKGQCGPSAGYAMVINNYRADESFEPNIFTRDGIKTLRSVEFMSPLQKYVGELMTYIGGRVDDHAKDGTTTSILFSAALMKNLISAHAGLDKFKLSVFNINLITKQVFEELLNKLGDFTYDIKKLAGLKEDETLSVEDEAKWAGIIAFTQALSSSGGDVELAQAMKTIMEKSPSISWDSIDFHTSRMESKEPWIVEIPDYDYRLPCSIETKGVMNHAGASELLLKDVKVLSAATPLSDASLVTERILSWLDTDDDSQHILIIGTTVAGSLITRIKDMNQDPKRLHKVILIQHLPGSRLNGQPYNWDINVLNAISGTQTLSEADFEPITEKEVFTADEVHWQSGFLYFKGIIPDADPNSLLHPYFKDSEIATPFYTETLNTCRKMIEDNDNGHVHNYNLRGVYINALNDLTCYHRPYLQLGGTTHDQLTNRFVATDVEGAILSSLKHGFVLNGPLTVIAVCEAVRSDLVTKYQKLLDSDVVASLQVTGYINTLLDCIVNAMKVVVEPVFKLCTVAADEYVKVHDPKKYLNALDLNPQLRDIDTYLQEVAKLPDNVTNLSADGLRIGSTYPVFQPIAITTELLKRAQELLIKFMITNKIIIMGGVVADTLADKQQ